MITGSTFGYLYTVVNACETHATLHDFVKFLKVSIEQVPAPAVAINHDRNRIVENGRVLGITVVGHHN